MKPDSTLLNVTHSRTEVASLKAQITDAKDESTKRAEAEISQLTADIYSLKVRQINSILILI